MSVTRSRNERTTLTQIGRELTEVRHRIGELRTQVERGEIEPHVAAREARQLQEREAELAAQEEREVTGHADRIAGTAGRVPASFAASFAGLFDAENHVEELRSKGILKEIAGGGNIGGRVKLGEISGERLVQMFSEARRMQAAAGTGIPVMPSNIAVSPVDQIVPLLLPVLPFLTLFPTQTTDYRTIEYQQRKAVAGGSAPAPTAPGSTKPPVDFEYDAATCGTETIAGWVKINRQDVDDDGLLFNTIRADLMQAVWAVTQSEILNGDASVGDGSAGGILGLLQQPDITVADVSGDDTIGDKLISGLRDVSLTNATANFLALNPTDMAALAKTKTTTAGDYSLAQLTALVEKLYPDVQWVTAPGLPTGTALAGDSNRAATLLIRQGMSLYLGLDSDDLTKNRSTSLAEIRLALQVRFPAAIASIDIS